MKLKTRRRELFVREYMIDLNGKEAALRAGYSKKNAKVVASTLLREQEVVDEINRLMEERAKKVELSAEVILRELLRIATVDISQAFDEMGGLKPLNEIPEDVRRAIAGIEVSEIFDGSRDQKHAIGLNRKVKFWDKPKALEVLGKHLKLFTDRVEHSGSMTLEQLVAGGKKE